MSGLLTDAELEAALSRLCGTVGKTSALLSDAELAAAVDELRKEIGKPRCLFLEGVRNLPGLSYADQATRAAYIKAGWPFDTAVDADNMARVQSSCGIITETGWRYAGVVDPDGVIYLPYAQRVAHGGTWYAVTREIEIAKRVGAWVSAIPWVEGTPFPLEADACIIGCSACGSDFVRGNVFNGEHEFTAVLWGPNGLLYSVDGGQPGIKWRARAIIQVWTGTDAQGRRTGELWAGQVDPKTGLCPMGADGRPLNGRRFVGYVNVDKLPLADNGNTCGPGAVDGQESKLVAVGKGAAAALLLVGAAWGIREGVRALANRV